MKKPILYKANETDFSTYGLGVLADEINTLVTEERNGRFYLEMNYPTDSLLFKELKADRLIKVSASHKLKDQRFKIIRIIKVGKGTHQVYAEHVSHNTGGMQLKPNVNFSGNAQEALNVWANNMVDEHPFTVYSDISTTGKGNWNIGEVEHARQALGGVQGSILDTYGGEYRFDNHHIGLYKNRGVDNGLPIMYGKNLTDLEQEEEIANTYTSIMPYSTFIPEDEDEPITLTLPEYYVDSEHVDKYARRKILRVDFSGEEITNENDLRTRAERYIEENNVGVPKVSLRVKFIDLAKTLDYKGVAKSEEVNLCDWVTVYFDELGINTKAKIVKTVWSPILERYEEVEIGDARASLSSSIDNVVDGKLDNIEQNINRVQIAANGKTKIFRGPDEPTSGMREDDLWYKPVGDGEIEMYVWTGTYWKLEKVSAGLLGGTLDVENGDVNLININANNITANRGNFISLAMAELNSQLLINGQRLRYMHTNKGSETVMSADGLLHVDSTGTYETSYLNDVITVTGLNHSKSSPKWVRVPAPYRGKQFTAVVAFADAYGLTEDADYENLTIQRLVCFVDIPEIDYEDGWVPLAGYSYTKNIRTGARKYFPIQVQLFIQY